MLYSTYEMQRTLFASASNWASIGSRLLNNPALPLGYLGLGPAIASALQVFAHIYEDRGKPAFGIETVQAGGKPWDVTEQVVLEKPFGSLRHFKHSGLPKDGTPINVPKV